MHFCYASDYIWTYMRGIKVLFTLLLIFMASSIARAQFNLKIAYNPIYGSFSGINAVQNAYISDDGEVLDGFGDLHFMHGIQLGIRYRVGTFGVELGWESLAGDREALALNPNSEVFTTREYDYDLRTWSFALDQYFRPFGFGAAITRTNFSAGRVRGNNNIPLIDESKWGLRFQLNLIIQESSRVSLLLRPYYQFYFGDYNIERLATDLNNTAASRESLSYFGLSLVFYNGRHY